MFPVQSMFLCALGSKLTWAYLDFLFHGWSEAYHQEVIAGIKTMSKVKKVKSAYEPKWPSLSRFLKQWVLLNYWSK